MNFYSGSFVRALAVCGAFAVAGSVHAQSPQRAPLNPAFSKYQEIHAQQQVYTRTTKGAPLGYAPSPLDLSYLRGRHIVRNNALQSLPLTYDLRTLGRVTPIKNQNPYGTCWAFATYGSLESCLLPSETRDFSENNLANCAGFDYGFDDGGDATMSTAYLVRWSGPIDEADDPYPDPGHSPSNLTVQKHVQEVIFLPLKSGALDNNTVKEAVIQYGAVWVPMYWEDSFFNTNHSAYYYPGTNEANHAVTIVGWDDTYPSNRFNQTAPGNGAFMVRNSWGTNWGDHGYFYSSYYDTRFGIDRNVVYNNAQAPTNYGTVYQYDPLGWITSYGYGTTNAWGANIFTATSTGALRAVSFYAVDINTSYEIYLYRDVTAGCPRSGTLEAAQSGTLVYPGYHTLALTTPVAVSSGQSFSVVIQFSVTSNPYPVPAEYAQAGYSRRATASPNQSYISAQGTQWTDLTTLDSTANVCIKAFAGEGSVPGPVAPGAVGDYDGDGKVDPAVYQESTGRWILLLSAFGYTRHDLGASYLGGIGYRCVTADYDGDGKADPAVYQESTGNWAIKLSACGYDIATVSGFGGAGYTSLIADFDGDGKADPAIYQTSSGNWAIKLSGNSYLIATLSDFGGAGYTPLVADFDSDHKADPAIYQAATGDWYVKLSASDYGIATITGFGGSNYGAFAADFDGDRKADPSVQDPTAGAWLIKLSASGYDVGALSGFGGASCGHAFAGDYDGDGKADPALYQASTGTWYFRLSSCGYGQATASSGTTP